MLEQLFAGGGEMGALMRSLDWSQTQLGPVSGWAQSLKTAVSILLNSRYPMFIGWRRELVVLYNDAYRPILGGKHPQFLGKPLKEMWVEIWDVLGPLTDAVLNTGRSTWSEDLPLLMERNGYLEEAYFTFSFSPVRDESGGIGGVFCAGTETTDRIIGERRLRTLRELAANTAAAKTVEEAFHLATAILSANPHDIPFALLYLVEPDGQQARLAGTTTNIEAGTIASPRQVDLTQETDGWHLAQVHRTATAEVVTNLTQQFGALPGGAWSDPPNSALVMPLAKAGLHQQLAGLLIIGINPRREFDDRCQGFFDLVSNQVATSITNANAYEAERKRAEALAELDQAKTAFFSNVSHEFRTPLTLILGPLGDMLANPTGPNPGKREQLEVAYRNSQRLLKLVNTLLDFSRIEAGRIEALYEPTDLAMLTTDLAGVFRSAIKRAGLRLRVDCPPLPEPAYVDREMWEKIVLNLLSNAFKFTFEGEIAVVLRLRQGDEKDTGTPGHGDAGNFSVSSPLRVSASSYVELEVRDTGIGISTEEQSHIFERFHRVKGAKGRSYEGSGIGLSLVQELVRLHGGTIQVSSVVDEGTCFIVSIPTGCAHLPSEHIAATRTLTSTAMGAAPYVEEALRWLPEAGNRELENSPSSPLSPPHILLADDNADMRDYLKRLLSQYYEVESVADGLAALTAARQQLPDLVLADVMMPGLDGFGLLRELRTDLQTRELPIILLSARAGEESRVEGLKAGADDYLIKPFSARELLARVEANLKLARLRQEAAQQERELRAVSEAARSAAQAAEARVESVLSSINDQFLVLDREWRYAYVNDRVVEVVGLPREELLGKCVWELYPDTVGSQLYTEFHRVMAEQTVVQFEYFYPGWQRWFEIRGYPAANGISVLVTEINDRKQVEEALRESEERLRAIVNQATTGIVQSDLTGRIMLVNQKYCDITGYSREELLQKRMQDITHPDDLPRNVELFQRLETEGKGFAVEKRYIRKDGSEVWVDNSVSPIRNAAGQVQSAVAVVLDVSDRKQAETALHISEAKFRAVFEQMYQFMGLLTPDGTLLEVNQAPLTFANVEHSAVIGQPFWEFPSWKATAELQEIAKTACAQAGLGQFFHKEVSIPDANGQLYTFDVSAKPITAPESNQIVWLLVEGRNISTLVRLRGALRQEQERSLLEQERSLQLINSSVDGIVAFDANGCCTLWNPAMKQLTGIQQEEAMGKSGMDVFSAFLDAKMMQSFALGTAETATVLDLHFIHLKTGQRQWVEARYSPLHDGDDTPHGGLMIVRDVTKQRELEWMKREFISIISHEIRTPLSSIRGSLGLVASGLLDDDPETVKEMLGIANNNIERLVRLVNDILALNRLESGQVKLKKQWCDEAALVQQAFSNVQNLAHSNQITLQSSVSEIQIWADPDWLVQVLVNLINNAVKFSPAGTTVSVSTQTQTQQVFFQVTDQGRGIPTEKLETIFERFQQVDASDSRQKGGTGLGLAICRLIVQLHDGRIWAESELGQGSTFCFTLPIPQRSHL